MQKNLKNWLVKLFFPNIVKLSVDLQTNYVDNLNKQEAGKRTDTLINMKRTVLTTEATATTIEGKTNIIPKTWSA